MVALPIVLVVVSYIIYKKYYKLNGEYYQNIMNIMALRKENDEIDVTVESNDSCLNKPIIDLKEKNYAN